MELDDIFYNDYISLFNKQKEIVKDVLIRKDALIGADMGTGKTIMVIYLIKAWFCFNLIDRVLLLCKPEVRDKFIKELCLHVPGLTEDNILYASKDNRDVFRDLNNKKIIMADYNSIKLVYYYMLGGKKENKRVKCVFPIDERWGVVLDEVQYIKNIKSAMYKIIYRNTRRARSVVALSGTPIEDPEELWAVFSVIREDALNTSYYNFIQSIAHTPPNSLRILYYKDEGIKRAWSKVNPYIYRLKKEEMVEMVNIDIVDMDVPLEGGFKRDYELLRKAVTEEIKNNPKMTLAHFIHRIFSFMKFIDLENPRFRCFDSLVRRLVQSEKLIIWDTSPETIKSISSYYEKLGIKSVYICGEVDKEERAGIIEKFKKQEDIRLFICSNLTTSESWEIPSTKECHRSIFYSLPLQGILYSQSISRQHRISSKEPVIIYRLLLQDSADLWCKELLEYKIKLADGVINAKEFNKLEELSYMKYLGIKKDVFGRRWGTGY